MEMADRNKSTEYAPHHPSKLEEVRTAPGAWSSTQNPNYAFTKSALAFRDTLDQIRGRNARIDSNTSAASTEAEKPPTVTINEVHKDLPTIAPGVAPLDRRVQILRVVQHALLSATDATIAVLQSLVYIKWAQTKNVPDAWPQHSMLFPTLVLLAVSVMALLFDASSLVAYIFPTKPVAKSAYRFAVQLHYWITSLKAFSYSIAAAVCRTGFSMGNQQDLWGWSCSAQGQAMAATNDAGVNCTGNTVAWALSLVNIAVEVIGVLITQIMENSKRKAEARAMTNDDAKPLIEKVNNLENLRSDFSVTK
ncbi:hypothetical protein E8E11_007323 [Didymella keratinophila]|nr:hypothetical protein E8E11_007323 [Didymella keratinophila]